MADDLCGQAKVSILSYYSCNILQKYYKVNDSLKNVIFRNIEGIANVQIHKKKLSILESTAILKSILFKRDDLPIHESK